MTAEYSHDIRVLTCQGCGAPIDAGLLGGLIICGYCRATHTVARRDEDTDRERARLGLGASLSESERYAQLRLQQSGEQELPQNLRPWLLPDGALNPVFAEQARTDWLAARQQLAAGSKAFNVAERLFYLTLLLAEQLDARRSRALLETAAELLADERHRHVVRCMLARRAAQHSDALGAQAWLETCNPRPTDLTMDTAYRYAAATLAVVQNDVARLGELLGTREGDVPLAARDAFACELLRIHGLEQGGQLDVACRELETLALARGEQALQRQLAAHQPLVLCPHAYGEQQRRVSSRRDVALLAAAVEERTKVRTGGLAVAELIGELPFLALALLVLIAPIRCLSDADPLLGVYGMPLCPQVCSDCYGPTRTVTNWRHSNGSHSTDGAEYFCNTPRIQVARFSDDRLEEEASKLNEQRLGFVAAAGGSYLTLLALLLLPLPITGSRRHRARAARAQTLDREIQTLCQRLQHPPPALDLETGPYAVVRQLRFFVMSVVLACGAIALSLAM